MLRWIKPSVVLTVMMCLLSILPVQAQGNLLSNSEFEFNYSGRGRGDFNFAENWGGWFTEEPRSESWMNIPPNAFPHTSYYKYGGAAAQSISRGGGTFTAAAYQEVGNIPAGAIVRGSAFVFLENASGNNARVRVGVGSNVGNNPFGGNVTWSEWGTTLLEYRQLTVDHIATGGNVTIFIYATQDRPNDPNAVYIDDAALVIVGDSADLPGNNEGGDESGGDTAENAPAPQPQQPSGVAFVSPQDRDVADGINHTVSSGDTLASIAVGYGVSMDQVMNLNGLDRTSVIQIGQVLVIATPDPNATPIPTSTPVPTEDATSEEQAEVVEADPDNQLAPATPQSEVVPSDDSSEVVITDPVITQEMVDNFRLTCSVSLILRAPFFELTCGSES